MHACRSTLEDPTNWDELEAEKAALTSLPAIQKASLKDLGKAALVRDNNPNKSLPRKWAAEAYAIMGNVDKARDELKALTSLGAPQYYHIEPLVQIYFAQQAAAPAEAGKALDEAIQAAANLPENSRRPLDAVSDLASALVIADRAAEAQTLLSKPALGSRAVRSLLWTAASHGRVYDFSTVEAIPAWTGSIHPQWAAVTWIVAARGYSDQALSWAKAAPSAEVRDGCLAAWAARVGLGTSAVDADKIEAALVGESQSACANSWANFGFARSLSGDAAGAKAAVEKADAALAELTAPPPMRAPGIAEIHASAGMPRAGLPDPSPMMASALAASSVARAHQALGDAAAESHLQAALGFSAATAPSVAETRGLLEECEKNRNGVQERLAQAINLKRGANRGFYEFNQYRRQCMELDHQAQVRLNLERAILRNAASHGLAAAAWGLVKERQQSSDMGLRQPFYEDNLPGFIAFHAYAGDDATTGKDIESSFAKNEVPYDRLDEIAFTAGKDFNKKDSTEVLVLLKKIYGEPKFDHERLDNALLRSLAVRAKVDKSDKTFDLVWRLSGESLREDALWLLAARSVAAGETPALWKAFSKAEVQRRLQPADLAAMTRGFIDGIANAPDAAPASTAAPAPAAK